MEEAVYRELFMAVQGLPEICQQIFLLRLEGKSKQAIARELGMTEQMVHGQLRFGQKILHKQLSGLIPLALLHSFTYME